MANFKTGLIVGKFYPPHRGHKYLIETAQAQTDHLIVWVCDKPGENPPARLRAGWLREMHPEVEVQVITDIGKDDDSVAWADYTRQLLGYAPDAVFTSEDYGYAYAHYLGGVHRQVDKARRTVPISARQIRANPYQFWNFLEPPVRAFYALRICLVGAESTGKTTLARALAAHYQTEWVPEYGRLYTEERAAKAGINVAVTDWTSNEFTTIAEEQIKLEDAYARRANRVLICDTDAFATALWHRRYLWERSAAVEALANQCFYPLYILTGAEIPFEDDGTRDGQPIRHQMQVLFERELKATSRNYLLVAGQPATRLQTAITAIDTLLAPKHPD